MSFSPVITLDNVGKCYQIYDKPRDRLLQMFWRQRRRFYREFWALRDLSLQVRPGEVVGIIGANGAGKSTLLQLVCGTLTPSCGQLQVNGRVAALLELGAGFNPEFTGRENVFLSAAVLGMAHDEIAARFEEIVAFSGIEPFIDQPVKTYSSGMYVRLAFAVAIHVDPDILVIDEALSVGDGEFARKSFDRIMHLKEMGRTILFCSHALYQVEALCNRAIWLDRGQVRAEGDPASVIVDYNAFLDIGAKAASTVPGESVVAVPRGRATIERVSVLADGIEGTELNVSSGETELCIQLRFRSDPTLPCPSVAIMLTDMASRPIASAGTHNDGIVLQRDSSGGGQAKVVFPGLPLLKGEYWVYAFLMCENGIHFYEYANMVARLHVRQQGLELGVVTLPHHWN
jgi:lipopolysaccharide transport system ATP-binding protein